jgi:hypothetical protein
MQGDLQAFPDHGQHIRLVRAESVLCEFLKYGGGLEFFH